MDGKTPTHMDAPTSTASRTMAKVFMAASILIAALLLGGFFWLMFKPL